MLPPKEKNKHTNINILFVRMRNVSHHHPHWTSYWANLTTPRPALAHVLDRLTSDTIPFFILPLLWLYPYLCLVATYIIISMLDFPSHFLAWAREFFGEILSFFIFSGWWLCGKDWVNEECSKKFNIQKYILHSH